MDIVTRLFYTAGLVAMLGIFSIHVTSEKAPELLKDIESSVALVGIVTFVIMAFFKIWT
jgi:peptidoglycan biosynthesis protein MviN/MurJ (putative lipid II flippase)